LAIVVGVSLYAMLRNDIDEINKSNGDENACRSASKEYREPG
jgi:hypothetical protein